MRWTIVVFYEFNSSDTEYANKSVFPCRNKPNLRVVNRSTAVDVHLHRFVCPLCGLNHRDKLVKFNKWFQSYRSSLSSVNCEFISQNFHESIASAAVQCWAQMQTTRKSIVTVHDSHFLSRIVCISLHIYGIGKLFDFSTIIESFRCYVPQCDSMAFVDIRPMRIFHTFEFNRRV